jgi:heptosyltransferase-3
VTKCWPLDNFVALAAILKQNGLQVAFLLGPAEQERFSPDQIRQLQSVAPILSDLTLTESMQLLCCADLFVGNDSGISHLAAALGIRSLVLFGPSNPCLYQPIGPNVRILSESPQTFARPDPQVVQKVAEAALQRLAD